MTSTSRRHAIDIWLQKSLLITFPVKHRNINPLFKMSDPNMLNREQIKPAVTRTTHLRSGPGSHPEPSGD